MFGFGFIHRIFLHLLLSKPLDMTVSLDFQETDQLSTYNLVVGYLDHTRKYL